MRTRVIYFFSIIGVLLLGAFLALGINYYLSKEKVEYKAINEVNIEEADTIRPSIDKVYDAVLLLEAYKSSRLIGTGTGFIYKQDEKYGYIITNHHVVDGASEIKVINTSGAETIANILGKDEYADIAVLSVDKSFVLQVAEIGASDRVDLGDTVFTVGSPLGMEYMGTVTKGILSGKNRTVSVELNNGSYIMEVLQTDAAINPGNSGGPLLDINGQVIGVNSLKLVEAEIEGMGFALPIEIVMGFVDRLEKGETIKRPMIGAELIDVSNAYLLYKNQIYLKSDIDKGVAIATIEANRPASDSGLKRGDVIIAINDNNTDDIAHFRYNLYKYSIGDVITIKYVRDNKTNEVKVLLDETL